MPGDLPSDDDFAAEEEAGAELRRSSESGEAEPKRQNKRLLHTVTKPIEEVVPAKGSAGSSEGISRT